MTKEEKIRFDSIEAAPIQMDRSDGKGVKDGDVDAGKNQLLNLFGYKYGFPRTSAKKQKRVHGFQTGDLVKAIVPGGKKVGTHSGRVSIRTSGSFNIRNSSQTIQGIRNKYCCLLQKADGYTYNNKKQEAAIPPRPKGQGFLAVIG